MSEQRRAARSGGDANFAAPAELIGHPARAAMLVALLDGRALPMTMLAAEAGVAASTASEHLGRLVEGKLLSVTRQGRHRYYSLASGQVAEALEKLAVLGGAAPVRSLRGGTKANALRFARGCYDHLAGSLGVAVMTSLLRQDALAGGDGIHRPDAPTDRLSAPGHDVDYRLTERGRDLFDDLGIVVPNGKRRLVRYCVDWTEQRHHLAGAAGAAILTHFDLNKWIVRGTRNVPRAISVTREGESALRKYFAIEVDVVRSSNISAAPEGAAR
jgi:DNA-binding transcriptional ArsR family regulator